MAKKIIVAIDGPAGSGKSTIAKRIAENFNFLYVDTGAMYRAFTFAAIEKGIENDDRRIIEMLDDFDVSLKFENGITRVFLNDREVTDEIRKPVVNEYVSQVSKVRELREKLVAIQRSFAEKESLIAEGRDTTTVVYPNADLKIYLTATLGERAMRRYKEFADSEEPVDYSQTMKNLESRDKIDSTRNISPLKKADDAIELDTTNLSINEVVKKISDLINNYIN